MIKIFSTYTQDIIQNQESRITAVRNGGPALFLEQTFKKHRIQYKMNATKAEVLITITANGEEKGISKSSPEKRKIKYAKNDIVIISTIGKEYILDDNLPKEARVFLDIQGYIREKNKNLNFLDNIFCIKGNHKEINKLSKKILLHQKKKLLIVTNGKNGATIYFKNKKYRF